MKLSRPLILLALAAILPLTLLSAVLGVSSLRQEQRAMQTEAEARVDLAEVLVQQALNRHVAVLSTVAQSQLFDGQLDLDRLSTDLDRVARSQAEWVAIFLSDAEGKRIVTVPSGRAYPARVVDLDSHRVAVRTARPVVGQIMRRPNGILAFAVRVPIVRGGKVLYVVSALVAPDGLRSLFLANPLPAGWRAGLVDASGRVVVAINARQEAVGGFATPDTLKVRAQSPSGFAETRNLEGAEMISAYKILPAFGWSVHAAIPLDAYRAPIVRSLWLLGATGAVTLSLAGLFLWLLMRELAVRQRQAAAAEEAKRMEALGRMTGGVAHDFNNLLMIVQGSAEMVKRRRGEPERVGALADAILSAAQRGQSLTRQLLAFARRGRHEPVDFLLQDRVAALAELIRRAVGDKVVTTVTVGSGVWAVRADPDALEIALINLAVNARDAMPDGGALLISTANVSMRRERGAAGGLDGEFVAITVKDTGGGIPEEHLGHIFEPFYTTKPAGRGTGLGLSQVYGFARQSGGAVTVASRPGEGAIFTIYLPRATRQPTAPVVAPPTAAATVPAGHVLLVEDDSEVARAVEAMLTAGGHTVSWVRDGPAALALVEARPDLDAVLSDRLLDGGGEPLIDALRRARPDLAVLLMSGLATALDEASGEIVLMKPFGPDQLFAALARARGPAGPGAPAQPRRV